MQAIRVVLTASFLGEVGIAPQIQDQMGAGKCMAPCAFVGTNPEIAPAFVLPVAPEESQRLSAADIPERDLNDSASVM